MNNGEATITDSIFEGNEARGGSGNRGDGTSFQFVGTALGGAISTAPRGITGEPAILTLSNVSLRDNRAVGGAGNAAGTYVGIGTGGGLASGGDGLATTPSGGGIATVLGSTIADNQAIGGRGSAGSPGGDARGGGIGNFFGGILTVRDSTLTGNRARGGAGGSGASGQGGGLFNDGPSTHPSKPRRSDGPFGPWRKDHRQ